MSFTYDAVRKRTQMVDGTGTTSYSYDNIQRLTSVTYPGPSTDTYTYDVVGNRTAKNSTSYTYNAADQLMSTGGVNYGYDSNGNQNVRGSDSFGWDYENRLTSATVSGTQTTYTYNADGLRQTRASGGTTTSYTWDVVGLPKLLQDGTNTYVYGLGLISTTDGSGNQTYPLHDGLGSTVALANGSGTVTGTYAYDVFGAVRSHTGGTTEFGFTGEQNDPNALEYLRARYYDPAIGRFVSEDSWFALATVPTTLNRYTYANNNPVNATDPSGRSCLGAMNAALAGEGAGGFVGAFVGACGIGAGAVTAIALCGPACREAGVELVRKGAKWALGKLGIGGGGDVKVTPPNPDPKDPNKPPIIVSARGTTFVIDGHAFDQMELRSLSPDMIAETIENNDPFSYYLDGAWREGYYNSTAHIFVGTIANGDGTYTVTTAIYGSGVNDNYILNLILNSPQ